jgi:hypothetical protein
MLTGKGIEDKSINLPFHKLTYPDIPFCQSNFKRRSLLRRQHNSGNISGISID